MMTNKDQLPVLIIVNNLYLGRVLPSHDVWFAQLPEGEGKHFTTKQIAIRELINKSFKMGKIKELSFS